MIVAIRALAINVIVVIHLCGGPLTYIFIPRFKHLDNISNTSIAPRSVVGCAKA